MNIYLTLTLFFFSFIHLCNSQIITDISFIFRTVAGDTHDAYIGKLDCGEKEAVYRMPDQNDPRTRPIYQCKKRIPCTGCSFVYYNRYISLNPYCDESNTNYEKVGYLYTEHLPNTAPLYRCKRSIIIYNNRYVDYFISNDVNCEGKEIDVLLGYSITRGSSDAEMIYLYRSYSTTIGHFTDTINEPPAICRADCCTNFESKYKILANPVDNSRPLYFCVIRGKYYKNNFVSLDSNCEGQKYVGLAGYIYSQPMPNTAPLYRCYWSGKGSHVITPDSGCEKHPSCIKNNSCMTLDYMLGYFIG
jgi:hypothetical protein